MPAASHAPRRSRTRAIQHAILVAAVACGAVAHANSTRSTQPDRTAQCPTTGATGQEQRFARLVCIRNRAIETAFGPLFDGREIQIRIEFLSEDDPLYPQASMSSYDAGRHIIYFRRRVLMLAPEAWYDNAVAYWTYYQGGIARSSYPVIGIVDEALWDAHLGQAAHERGLTWPNEDCRAIDISRRLGCEMLITAIAQLVQSPTAPLLNANRLDLLWPGDLADFERRAWARRGREYRDVCRLGGLMLLEPLVREFGVPRVFAYAARTPFRIENNDVRLSALRYQDDARSTLAL